MLGIGASVLDAERAPRPEVTQRGGGALVAENGNDTTWLREFRTAARPRAVLVCFPPGGGSASAYRDLARGIGEGVEVLAVQYPGRQDRLGDPMVADIGEMADRVAADVLVSEPSAPLALFGHSMGATVAFETARRLEAEGRTPVRLFVSGRIAPSAPYPGRLHDAPDADLIAELERLANDPAAVAVLRTEPGLADLVLPAVRNDYRAVETYRCQPGDLLRCDISALLGADDPTVTAEQARAWQDHTTGEFELATFPGRHFYLDERPSEIAEFVAARLP
ncbi:thioesterase II family protein [Nocardia blacklockiae]|uniref:thioesterase II family protein n=1 Tax=Nocardia blacklockiae TaxID=480036 RepID=UPI0018949426|nr:alpha/beta fold hydrolase [Nocardia blacklockiae]MBF6170878.1 thioesterase [Nocardia blacklockiae]